MDLRSGALGHENVSGLNTGQKALNSTMLVGNRSLWSSSLVGHAVNVHPSPQENDCAEK